MKIDYELLFLESYYKGQRGENWKLVGGLGMRKVPYIFGYNFHIGGNGMTVAEIHYAIEEENIDMDDVGQYVKERCSAGDFEIDNKKVRFSLSSDLQKKVDTSVRELII